MFEIFSYLHIPFFLTDVIVHCVSCTKSRHKLMCQVEKKKNCIQLKNTTMDNLKYFIQTFNSFVYSFSETIYSQTRWFFTLQKNNLSCFLHFQAIKVKGKYVLNKSRFTVRCSEHVQSLNRHPCYSNLCMAKEEAQREAATRSATVLLREGFASAQHQASTSQVLTKVDSDLSG